MLSPANNANIDTFSTVSSQEYVIPKVPQEKITNGAVTPGDAKPSEDSQDRTLGPLHGVDVRARSVSDVINVQRNRMASIAEDAETMAAHMEKVEKTVNNVSNGTAMQENASMDQQPQSPRKIATVVPPQVTDLTSPTKTKNTFDEIPVLPNVVIYNASEKSDRSESPFTYTTVAGAKTIELEASSSFVEVYDA